ncbi:MAG: glycosyltransferase [Cyclobacteriaceae bacterium]
MPKYSLIVPVYNRPEEVEELLQSLVTQKFKDFEVLIVEDGSSNKADGVAQSFQNQLNLKYHFKENEGQGFARNYGFERAEGEYFIVLDSDCIIPSSYLSSIDEYLARNDIDAFGGPDTDDSSFTIVQRTINLTMTSLLTTGGIRGNKLNVSDYHPRSFNMGFKREVYEATGGYIIPFMGEDIEFSVRLLKMGFTTALIPEAVVIHKRRTSLIKFFKQMRYFGRARINLSRFHKGQIKITFLFPSVFTFGFLLTLALLLLNHTLGYVGLTLYGFYFFLILLNGLITARSLSVAFLAPFVALLQLSGYGLGLVYEWIRKLKGINPNAKYIDLY